jgi:hypothetical protein
MVKIVKMSNRRKEKKAMIIVDNILTIAYLDRSFHSIRMLFTMVSDILLPPPLLVIFGLKVSWPEPPGCISPVENFIKSI